MLNIMSGIVHPTRGRIPFDGVDVAATDTSNRNIAQTFQFPVIYNTMTVQGKSSLPIGLPWCLRLQNQRKGQ